MSAYENRPRNQPLPRLARTHGTKAVSSARTSGRSGSGSSFEQRKRDLALFNLAIDSKPRGYDLVRLGVNDVRVGGQTRVRATVTSRKPAGRSSSRSPNKPKQRSAIG